MLLNLDQKIIQAHLLEKLVEAKNINFTLLQSLSERQIDILLAGTLINWVKAQSLT